MAETRLIIDFWHTTVSAALRLRNGRVMVLAVDGAAVGPCGVAIRSDGTIVAGRAATIIATHQPDRYVRLPGHQLLHERVTVGGVQVDPVDLVAAVLSMVVHAVAAATDLTVDETVIVTPSGWVRRQRIGLLAAARKVGLPTATLVGSAEAVVRDHIARGVAVPFDSVVGVVRFDASAGEVVLLRHHATALESLAVIDLGEVGEIDGVTLADQAAVALAQALDANNLTGRDLAAVVCQAPEGAVREMADALVGRVALTTQPTSGTDLGAVLGAVGSAAARTGPDTVDPSSGGLLRATIAMVLAGLGAGMVTYQMFASAVAYPNPSGPGRWLYTLLYAWAFVSVLATVGTVSAALLIAHARPALPAGRDPTLGSALIAAAVLGVSSAVMLSIVGAQRFQADPTPLVWSTLAATVPAAVIIALLGRLVATVDPPRRAGSSLTWAGQLLFPVSAVLLGALSTVSIVASLVAIPVVDSHLWWQMQHIGGFGLGWAVAFLLPLDPWRRIIAGFILAAVGAYGTGPSTAGLVVSGLIVAITLWWLHRLVVSVPGWSRRGAVRKGQRVSALDARHPSN